MKSIIGEWVKTNIPARLVGAFGYFIVEKYKVKMSDSAEHKELADMLTAFNCHESSAC